MKKKFPTSYSNVNEILNLLLSKVREILGDQLVGIYLYGSLSSGDFNPETSDIDFLVVTKEMLSDETIAGVKGIHEGIWASGLSWAARLEGSYIPQEDIRRHDPGSAPCPTVNEGKFYVDKRGSDWIIQRHVVRESGIVLEGPDPKSLIDPVGPDDIRRAVLGILQEWWFPMLDDPTWLRNHRSNYHGFTVITMCRALHALKHGTIASKPVAVRWAQKELGSQWQKLIEQAVASQYGKQPDFLDETLEFVRFTREQIQRHGELIPETGSENEKDPS